MSFVDSTFAECSLSHAVLADCSEDGAVLTYLKFQIGLTVKVKAFLFLYFRFLLLTLTEDDTVLPVRNSRHPTVCEDFEDALINFECELVIMTDRHPLLLPQ